MQQPTLLGENNDLFDLAPLRLDFGCGKTPRVDKDPKGVVVKEFEGVDAIDFGQKHIVDLRRRWPWDDQTVDEASSSHFIEHLDGDERVYFMNELYRVMKFDATATILGPHWSNDCAYGDPTHKWPPLSTWTHLYWNKSWRDANAPHTKYTCDFDTPTLGYSFDSSPLLNMNQRNQEYQQFAANHYRNGMRDIWFNLVKTKRT